MISCMFFVATFQVFTVLWALLTLSFVRLVFTVTRQVQIPRLDHVQQDITVLGALQTLTVVHVPQGTTAL